MEEKIWVLGFPGQKGLSRVQVWKRRGWALNPLLLQSIDDQFPSRVLWKGLSGTSEGHEASCLWWLDAVLPHAPHSSRQSFRSLAQIKSSRTILLHFSTDKVPLNQSAVTVSKPESLGPAMQLLGSAGRGDRDDTHITGRQQLLSQRQRLGASWSRAGMVWSLLVPFDLL